MIKLKSLLRNKRILCESMNVTVKGFQYARKLNLLEELTYHFMDRILIPVIQSFPPDQTQYFEKNKMGTVYDILVPDGSYYEGPPKGTGIINFYISGFTTNSIKKILRDILNEGKNLKVKFGKLKTEKSGIKNSQVIRIPIIQNNITPDEGPPELNMSNANAYHVFKNVLQFDPADEYGSSFVIDVNDLINTIMSIKGDRGWVGQNIRPDTDSINDTPKTVDPGDEWKQEDEPNDDPSDNPHDDIIKQLGAGGARIIGMGLDSDAINERISKILEIAHWAKSHGYSVITVN